MNPAKHGTFVMYADGAISPERAGVGIVLCDEGGHVVLLANRVLPRLTNNEAEYAALIMALEVAAQQNAQSVELRLDSEVVVNQMAGRFAVNSATLKAWHMQACDRARRIPHLTYTHIPRTRNGVAHALATEAVAGRRWCTKGAPCSG
ncbi:ribonuclease HI family protein [Aggregatilinea lenta]|uniref:ribonuclease HI family protein n=1 Tax=Aggregatilinea lenta TaxID=913108 RepID=UPI000E5AA0C9|nr:ribonuclease HI family protein [Aggregatilinea lenta]